MLLARYLCSVQVLKFDEYFIKIVPNDPKSWSQIVELIRNGIPKRFFGFGVRILRIGHFSGWKSKFFEVSSWHFKHPIKLNFLIWHLERPYPDKKSILEKRQFKSCPFVELIESSSEFYIKLTVRWQINSVEPTRRIVVIDCSGVSKWKWFQVKTTCYF